MRRSNVITWGCNWTWLYVIIMVVLRWCGRHQGSHTVLVYRCAHPLTTPTPTCHWPIAHSIAVSHMVVSDAAYSGGACCYCSSSSSGGSGSGGSTGCGCR